MTNKGVGVIVATTVLISGIIGAAIAKHHYNEPKITWYSDMTNQIQGKKIYLIDTPVTCPDKVNGTQRVPGKPLGHIKVDINLYNGDLKVVENNVPALFSCEK